MGGCPKGPARLPGRTPVLRFRSLRRWASIDRMIHEVDESIRALIRRDAVNGGDVEVAFDVPSKEWSAKRSKPTVNVYLFDIREDLARRRTHLEPVRGDEGQVTGRRRPPRHFRLSYLITAWTQRPEDEHRLLSAVLGAFISHEEFPRDALQGGLADLDLPLHLTVGAPPPAERSIGEIWNALGGELKPSLELVVIVPFDATMTLPAGPPVIEEPRFQFEGAAGQVEGVAARRRQGRGRVPAVGARIEPVEETVVGGKRDTGRIITIRTIQGP